ncbi:copper amine oxidase N-terminal domain-containing protein [Paenibacillus zeisoli]|uniref:Copper amine oxidase N-terminal domain-containing protein n=1 Tax=Paenibacillus zeisoli TaxID=2496267 RepID=A0A3S1B773_9BACL|nr:copper amine oxidase N-terminal domain-containing protein [Paenibacillus zeisoli]RUT33590.1 copper amine oxidase N-terminal domain-containing protein [Paenibacillus zeisoli]
MKLKKWISFMIIFAFVLCTTNSSYAASPKGTIPIILKMNDYYVAYTYPKVPYIDRQNRLMLPLRAAGELLGASVTYDPASRSAVITQNDNLVKIQVGSHIAVVNGEKVEMDTQPVMEKGYMIIPARILFDAFAYKVTLNHHVVTLKDDRMLRQGLLKYLLDDDRVAISRTLNQVAFEPLYYTLSTSISKNMTHFNFDFTARNITGTDIPQGEENLSTMIYFDEGGLFDIPYTSVDIKDRSRPAVKKDAIFSRHIEDSGHVLTTKPNMLRYILISGRTITPDN